MKQINEALRAPETAPIPNNMGAKLDTYPSGDLIPELERREPTRAPLPEPPDADRDAHSMFGAVRCDELRLSLMAKDPEGRCLLPLDLLDRLERAKETAALYESLNAAPQIALGGIEWDVSSTGAKPGYSYLLTSPCKTISLRAVKPGRTSPGLLLHIKGGYFVHGTLAAAMDLASRLARDFGQPPKWQISAIHLCCDVPVPMCEEWRQRLCTTSHKVSAYYSGDRLETLANYGGSAGFLFRIYDKRAKEKNVDGSAYRRAWKAAGIPEETPITRIEGQWRRKYLRQRFGLHAMRQLTPAKISALWDDFTGRCVMLGATDEEPSKRADRRVPAGVWSSVQSARTIANLPLLTTLEETRRARIAVHDSRPNLPLDFEVSNLLKAAAGMLATACIRRGVRESPYVSDYVSASVAAEAARMIETEWEAASAEYGDDVSAVYSRALSTLDQNALAKRVRHRTGSRLAGEAIRAIPTLATLEERRSEASNWATLLAQFKEAEARQKDSLCTA